MTYEEMLRAEGATEEDIKLLNTPVARKAFDKQQAAVAAAAEAQQKAKELIEHNRRWAGEVETANQGYLKERDTALVEVAAAKAKLAKMQELGLIEVAEKMEPGSTKVGQAEPGTFDPKVLENYVDRQTLLQVAELEGEGIASQADIIYEHYQLFGNDPTKRPNFRELRKEAVQRKVPMEQVWKEKYGVDAARAAVTAKEKSDYEANLKKDWEKQYKSEHPETNPLLGPQVISRTPFTGKVPSTTDAKAQPWNRSDADKENSRVARGVAALEKAGLVN
jgi:predicted amidohydrolase YtcJ